jgi:LPXTG-motif cell wall-anchored protein
VFVPGTDYSSSNHWEKEDTTPLAYDTDVSINGHMPFSVTSYPKEKKPVTFWQQNLWLMAAFLMIVIFSVLAMYLLKRKKKK